MHLLKVLSQSQEYNIDVKHLAASYHPLHHQGNHSTALFDIKHKGMLGQNLYNKTLR